MACKSSHRVADRDTEELVIAFSHNIFIIAIFSSSSQEEDRAKLEAAGCDLVFEPTSLYYQGEFLFLAHNGAIPRFTQRCRTRASETSTCNFCAAVEGAGEGNNVVGKGTAHPDAHETFVQVLTAGA